MIDIGKDLQNAYNDGFNDGIKLFAEKIKYKFEINRGDNREDIYLCEYDIDNLVKEIKKVDEKI